ncbi:hypothetical protein TUMSATVNIG1_61300 (plasmid) [Vibrio nigripulchritudo]|nr:hypothetical protein TUMSATVNIG1_61300 [Vibrio nigripulchritudo]
MFSAIVEEIDKQSPGCDVDPRLLNTVLEATKLICSEWDRERSYADKPMTPQEWMNCDDVGASSKYMLTVISGLGVPGDEGPIPRDADDLGRCIRMVIACSLEDKVLSMKGRGEKWTRIALNWEELVAWYDSEKWEEIYKYLNKKG